MKAGKAWWFRLVKSFACLSLMCGVLLWLQMLTEVATEAEVDEEGSHHSSMECSLLDTTRKVRRGHHQIPVLKQPSQKDDTMKAKIPNISAELSTVQEKICFKTAHLKTYVTKFVS